MEVELDGKLWNRNNTRIYIVDGEQHFLVHHLVGTEFTALAII